MIHILPTHRALKKNHTGLYKGPQISQKSRETPQNSRHQTAHLNHNPFSELTSIRRHHTQFSCPGDLAPWVCAPPIHNHVRLCLHCAFWPFFSTHFQGSTKISNKILTQSMLNARTNVRYWSILKINLPPPVLKNGNVHRSNRKWAVSLFLQWVSSVLSIFQHCSVCLVIGIWNFTSTAQLSTSIPLRLMEDIYCTAFQLTRLKKSEGSISKLMNPVCLYFMFHYTRKACM